jgi:hypothetical protein
MFTPIGDAIHRGHGGEVGAVAAWIWAASWSGARTGLVGRASVVDQRAGPLARAVVWNFPSNPVGVVARPEWIHRLLDVLRATPI